jgi:sugar lactone lactonase YvrE
MRLWRLILPITLGALAASAFGTPPSGATTASPSFLHQFSTVTKIASTVPANGDVNPYGVANVTTSDGLLVAGDTLVSNFNSKANVQGTGTTIVEVSPTGTTEPFARISRLGRGQSCPGGIGLSTALVVLPGGWVVVGSMPTHGGSLPAGDPVGCLIVLNSEGHPVETFTNKDIVGPWDMTVSATSSSASLFVSNALGGNTQTENGLPYSGNCTIARLDLALRPDGPPRLVSSTIIGSGYPWMANKAALVLAPTGLALGHNGTLYVDDTQKNTVSAIPDARRRTTPVAQSSSVVSSDGALNAPLGMTLAPNGNLIVVNGNNGNAVEITPAGKQIATVTLVKHGAGDLFGLTPSAVGPGILFVNDGTNDLDLFGS